MQNAPPSSLSQPAAHAVLERIFRDIRPGLRYRLWDGSADEIGTPDGSFTIVIRSPETFREAFSSNDTAALAEAYADGRIDVEGDLRACLRIANQLEDRSFTAREKLQLYFNLRRVRAGAGAAA